QEVVEVDQATPALLVFVGLVDGGHGGRGEGRTPAVGRGGRLVAGRGDHAGLGPLDLGGEVGGLGSGGSGGRLRSGAPPTCPSRHELGQDAHLAVQEGGRAFSPVGPAAPALGVGQAVEGARRYRVAH